MNKTVVIASVFMAAALTGILPTNLMAVYATYDGGDHQGLVLTFLLYHHLLAFVQDESGTNTEQEINQKNVGSGESTNNNCALNSIDSAAATVSCPVPPRKGGGGD